MTAQATRDALAEMDGWHKVFDGTWSNPHERKHGYKHPHAPTLDGADAAVPEGYEWRRRQDSWIAVHHDRDTVVEVPNTGETLEHKIADLYALALACRRAMENKA